MKQLTLARKELTDDAIREIVDIARIAYLAIKENPSIAARALSNTDNALDVGCDAVSALGTIAYIRHIWGEQSKPQDFGAFWDVVKEENKTIIPSAYMPVEP